MTNANVDQVVTAVDGQTLTLKYKDGERENLCPRRHANCCLRAGTPCLRSSPSTKRFIKNPDLIYQDSNPTNVFHTACIGNRGDRLAVLARRRDVVRAAFPTGSNASSVASWTRLATREEKRGSAPFDGRRYIGLKRVELQIELIRDGGQTDLPIKT